MKMIKTFLTASALIVMVMCIAGCASASSTSGSGASSQPKRASNALFDQLDPVIEKTFDNLSGRLNPRLRIALLPPNSADASAGQYVFDELYIMFVNSNMYDMVDRADIDKAIGELNFSWNGLVDDSTAANFGKFLGAQVVAFGNLPDIGTDRRRMVYRAIEVETGRMLGISSERF